MFEDKYKKELDNIQASDSFKNDTIKLLQELQNNIPENKPNVKTIPFYKKHKSFLPAAACFLFLLFSSYIINSNSSNISSAPELNSVNSIAKAFSEDSTTYNGLTSSKSFNTSNYTCYYCGNINSDLTLTGCYFCNGVFSFKERPILY